jgi:flagellar motor switch protein FliM
MVLSLYYYEEFTMKEIGTLLGVNESRVSQIHTKATCACAASWRSPISTLNPHWSCSAGNGKRQKIQTYNFKRPDRISKNQIRSLHFVHDRFARNASSSISAYLRMVVEISLDAIEQVTYATFLPTPRPYVLRSISLKPLDGQAALEVRPECIFPMIDRFWAGPASRSRQSGR